MHLQVQLQHHDRKDVPSRPDHTVVPNKALATTLWQSSLLLNPVSLRQNSRHRLVIALVSSRSVSSDGNVSRHLSCRLACRSCCLACRRC